MIVFNTCTIREKPDQRFAAHLAQARALKEADPERSSRSAAATRRRSASGSSTSIPFVDVAFGPGSIPHLADWIGAGGRGSRARALRRDGTSFAGDLPGPSRAAVPGVGAGLDGLQLDLLVLHRAGRARAGAEPPARRHRRRGRRARRGRRPRGHAARPERELLGARPRSRTRHGVRRASARRRRESTASSGSASRARTRRTSASR